MLIDQDIIPQHDVHRSSILQPIYRCISPDDIVCLDPGDKFIVVMLTVSKNTADLGHKVLWMYCKMFENNCRTNIFQHPPSQVSECC